MQAAGANLIPVSLELGGKSPTIVDSTVKASPSIYICIYIDIYINKHNI